MTNTKEKTNTTDQNAVILTDDIKELQIRIKKNLEYIMKINRIGTRKDLADKLGITPPQLTRIMNGEQLPTLNPFFIMLHYHSKEFGCTIDDFLFTDWMKICGGIRQYCGIKSETRRQKEL